MKEMFMNLRITSLIILSVLTAVVGCQESVQTTDSMARMNFSPEGNEIHGFMEIDQQALNSIRHVTGPYPEIAGGNTKFEETTLTGSLSEGVSDRGAIMFWFQTDSTYRTRMNADTFQQELIQLSDLFDVTLLHQGNQINLFWEWNEEIEGIVPMRILLPDLSSGWHHLTISWDAENGIYNAYLDGICTKLEEVRRPEWDIKNLTGADVAIHFGRFPLADFRIMERVIQADDLVQIVGNEHLGKSNQSIGANNLGRIQPDKYKGELVYSNPLAEKSDIEDWVLEGPGQISFQNGWMQMKSTRPDGPEGHIVHWCDNRFPESFVAQWDFKLESRHGLCIVFFAAKGVNDESIFHPDLQPRNGEFMQYVNGDIQSYHISYYANTPFNPGRLASNLRKNPGLYLCANGPIGINPRSDKEHQVTLIKNGSHIQLGVDGRKSIDWRDDGERFGETLQDGNIGFRQMQWTIGKYKDFRVYRLNKSTEKR